MAGLNKLSEESVVFQKKYHTRVTTLCNNNCVFCLMDKTGKECAGPTEDIKKEFETAKQEGYFKLILSGGEPTTHPHIIELVSYAKKLGFGKIQIVSNGRMFKYPEFTKRIISAGLDEVTFSIHGHTGTLHDELTQSCGSFEQAIRGVYNVKKYGNMIVNADIVIVKQNYRYLPDIVNFLMDAGIMELNLHSITPFGNAHKNLEWISYDFLDAMEYIHKAIDACSSRGAVLWTSRIPPQYLGGYEEYVRDSHKIREEMEGMISVFKNSNPPECIGTRCVYCKLQLVCKDLIKIKERISKKVKPEVVSLDLGCTGNDNCVFCVDTDQKHCKNRVAVPLDMAVEKLRLGRILGASSIELTGGEPTTHKKFFSIVRSAKEMGYSEIRIASDGRTFANKKFAEDAVSAGANIFLVPIHGSEKLHNRIVEDTQAFAQTVEGIKNLKKIGGCVETNTVLTKHNHRELEGIARFLKVLGVEFSHLTLAHPTGRLYRDYAPLMENIVSMSKDIFDFIELLKPKVMVHNIPCCFGSHNHFGYYETEGGRYRLKLNDFQDGVFDELKFVERTHNRLKIKGLICKNCSRLEKCPGVFKKYIRLYGFAGLKPVGSPRE